MKKYRFSTYSNGIGRNDYLSEGKHAWSSGIDIRTEPYRIQLEKQLDKINTTPDDINNFFEADGDLFACCKDGKIYYVDASWDAMTAVQTTSYSDVLNAIEFRDRVYLFGSTNLEYKDSSDVNDTSWTGSFTNFASSSISPSTNYRPIHNYLNARFYFGNGKYLWKVDEFNVHTKSVFQDSWGSDRPFSSDIVAFTVTGSVLNIYLENGTRSMMNLADETIIETLEYHEDINGVANLNNTDYIASQSWGIDTRRLYVASGYDRQEVSQALYSDITNEFFTTPIEKFYFSWVMTSNNDSIFLAWGSAKLSLYQYKNGSFSVITSISPDGYDLTNISAVYVQGWYLYISYKYSNGWTIYETCRYALNRDAEKCVSGVMITNVFTAWDYTRRKSLNSIRLGAIVPTGTTLKISYVADKGSEVTVETITPSTDNQDGLVYVFEENVSFNEIAFCFELTNTGWGQKTPEVYAYELDYDFERE